MLNTVCFGQTVARRGFGKKCVSLPGTLCYSRYSCYRSAFTRGDGAAATLVAKLGAKAEVARELCYRLYTLSERKKRAGEALAYNALVQGWPEILRLAGESKSRGAAPAQATLI